MSGKSPSVDSNPTYPGYGNAINQMAGKAQQYIGQMGTPYGGQLVAGFSPTQQVAQNYQQNVAGSMQPYTSDPLYQQAYQQLYNTVGGAYTSPNSPYTQQMSQYYMNQVYPQLQAQMNQQAGRMGNLSGSPYEYLNSQLGQAGQNQLLAYGAQNYATERQNQLNAVQPAEQMAQLTQAAPSALYNQLMQMGQAGQTQQQNELTAAYQEYQRQQNQLQQSLSPGSMLPTAQQQTYSYNPGSGGVFSNYIAPALDVGAAATGQSWASSGINAISGMTSQGGQVSPWSQGIQQGTSLYGSTNPTGLSDWLGDTWATSDPTGGENLMGEFANTDISQW